MACWLRKKKKKKEGEENKRVRELKKIATKPSAPSCKGGSEEAPGIEPVHPSCEGVPIPPSSLYHWATGGFLIFGKKYGSI
jgi:hypothetical protein